ncbi:MAG: peptidylprolyl isomerase [Desulfosarcina sp.]|nr:peptidylprolyl isomerase [Desulfobacterales bacterium]
MQAYTIRWITVFMTILLAVGTVAAQEQPKTPPPAATVNGVAISQQNFDFELQQTIGQMAQRGQMIGEEALPRIRQSVLNRIIEEELLFQASQAQGINVPEQRISEELAGIKKRFPSEEEYRTTMTTLKMTEEDLKRKIRRGLTIQQLIGTLVADVQVSEAEMKAFYDNNPTLFQTPEQVQARHILIKVEPEADETRKKEALQKIKDLQRKVKAGDDFAVLAQANSEGPSSAKGGDLGLFRRGQMVKPFEEAAFALQKDEVSEVVETRFGYHLIKVTDRRAAGTIGFEEARVRIAQNIKKEKEGQVVRQYLDELRAKADIKPQPAGMPTAKPGGANP